MKLLIIRHGDPYYEIDSLTQKGWKEAEYLSEKLCGLDVKAFYMSPLGRAQDTAKPTLEKLGRTAEVKEWLREFDVRIQRPDIPDKKMIAWDWLPQDWTQDEQFYRYDEWYKNTSMVEGHVKEEYDWVTGSFDKLLAEHGPTMIHLYFSATLDWDVCWQAICFPCRRWSFGMEPARHRLL